MSNSTLCPGCGRVVIVGDDYKRRKIQCPDCGVMCELPMGATSKKPVAADVSATKAVEPATASRASIPPSRPPASSSLVRPARAAPASRKGVVICTFCGELVKMRNRRGRPRQCPHCGAEDVPEAPIAPPSAPTSSPAKQRAPVAVKADKPKKNVTDEDEGLYEVTTQDPKCPQCAKTISPETTECPGCGFNLETGQKVQPVYQPVDREWEGGWPYRQRLNTFFAIQGAILTAGLASILFWKADPITYVVSWAIFSTMLAFLLGTYFRVNLKRNRRGQILLTKTWRVCFRQWPTETFKLSLYEGVVTGASNDVGFSDWFILFLLLLFGILPGVAWWYFVIRKNTYYAALAKDHGSAAEELFRGFNQERMCEVADTVADVGRLPLLS